MTWRPGWRGHYRYWHFLHTVCHLCPRLPRATSPCRRAQQRHTTCQRPAAQDMSAFLAAFLPRPAAPAPYIDTRRSLTLSSPYCRGGSALERPAAPAPYNDTTPNVATPFRAAAPCRRRLAASLAAVPRKTCPRPAAQRPTTTRVFSLSLLPPLRERPSTPCRARHVATPFRALPRKTCPAPCRASALQRHTRPPRLTTEEGAGCVRIMR